MRARDVRAIAFCTVTITALLAALLLTTGAYMVAIGVTAAYAAVVLTRPRMLRLYRRLRGEPDWSGYFDNGDRPKARWDRAEAPRTAEDAPPQGELPRSG
jgi:hypothetical protein